MTAQTIDIRDPDLEHRRLRFTIAHVGTVLGRNKTRLLLEAWVATLNNGQSPESEIMDQMHEENNNAEILSSSDDSPLGGDQDSVEV